MQGIRSLAYRFALVACATAVLCWTSPAAAKSPVKAGPPGGLLPQAKFPPGVGFVADVRENPLTYYGGPVLRSNETFAIYWDPAGSLSPSYRQATTQYLVDVAAASGATDNVYSVLNQYYDTTGPIAYDSTYAGTATDADPYPNGCPVSSQWPVCMTNDQIAAEVDAFLDAQGIGRPPNRSFFVLLPPGVDVCIPFFGCRSGGAFSAFHSEFTGGNGPVTYAVHPYPLTPLPGPNGGIADQVINGMSHEHREMINDPFVQSNVAWYDFTFLGSTGGEGSDKCFSYFGPAANDGSGFYNQVINGHRYLLQTEFSNALQAQQGLGCVTDGTDQPPVADFTIGVHNARVTTTASASDPDAGDAVRQYVWFWGDGTIGFGPSAQHQYRAAGDYQVVLHAQDGHAATGRAAHVVHVSNPSPKPTRPFNARFDDVQHGFAAVSTATGQASNIGRATETATLFGDFSNFPTSFDVFYVNGRIEAGSGGSNKPALFVTAQMTLTDTANPPAGTNYRATGSFTIEGGTLGLANSTGGGTISGTCTSSFTDPDVACMLDWDGVVGGG